MHGPMALHAQFRQQPAPLESCPTTAPQSCRAISVGGQSIEGHLVPIQRYMPSERYSSFFRCHGRELLYTRHSVSCERNCREHAWETFMRTSEADSPGSDAFSEPAVALPAIARLSHNAAFLCQGKSVLGFGGRDRHKFSKSANDALRHESGIWRIESRGNVTHKWSHRRHVINGSHPGCVERRVSFYPICEYDGRLSASLLGPALLLYARANTKRWGGGRNVQVASSLDGGQSFAPFSLISFENATVDDPLEAPARHTTMTDSSLTTASGYLRSTSSWCSHHQGRAACLHCSRPRFAQGRRQAPHCEVESS